MADFHLHHEQKTPIHAHDHVEEHLESTDFIRDVVIGMSDGLTVPFALAAGLSGAVSANGIIITAGIAEVAAGSIAMGLGGYLSGRTEIDHYNSELKREYWEVDNKADFERQEVRDIFAELGISEKNLDIIVDEVCQDKDRWVEFMMRYELGLEKPDPKRATKSAFTIGISYIVGGMIPLFPYFFTATPQEGLIDSAIVTTICLFIFGYFKSKMTGQPLFVGALKVTAIGMVAAATAFFVAKSFG